MIQITAELALTQLREWKDVQQRLSLKTLIGPLGAPTTSTGYIEEVCDEVIFRTNEGNRKFVRLLGATFNIVREKLELEVVWNGNRFVFCPEAGGPLDYSTSPFTSRNDDP